MKLEYAMTEDEVAEILGIDRSMVGKIQRRALAKLRKAFDKAGIEWIDITTEGLSDDREDCLS